jgi:hypothetical protein
MSKPISIEFCVLLLISTLVLGRSVRATSVQDSAVQSNWSIAIRESVSGSANIGWKDRFYFHTARWEDAQNGTKVVDNRTIWQINGPNPEIWLKRRVSSAITLVAVAKYQRISLSLQDSVRLSFLEWDKRLHASLNLYQVGLRVQLGNLPCNPYVGIDAGICRGSLETFHHVTIPQADSAIFLAVGNGGGPFVGATVGIVLPLYHRVSMFVECGYWQDLSWKDFEVTSAHGVVGQRFASFVHLDRNLAFRSLSAALGIEARL